MYFIADCVSTVQPGDTCLVELQTSADFLSFTCSNLRPQNCSKTDTWTPPSSKFNVSTEPSQFWIHEKNEFLFNTEEMCSSKSCVHVNARKHPSILSEQSRGAKVINSEEECFPMNIRNGTSAMREATLKPFERCFDTRVDDKLDLLPIVSDTVTLGVKDAASGEQETSHSRARNGSLSGCTTNASDSSGSFLLSNRCFHDDSKNFKTSENCFSGFSHMIKHKPSTSNCNPESCIGRNCKEILPPVNPLAQFCQCSNSSVFTHLVSEQILVRLNDTQTVHEYLKAISKLCAEKPGMSVMDLSGHFSLLGLHAAKLGATVGYVQQTEEDKIALNTIAQSNSIPITRVTFYDNLEDCGSNWDIVLTDPVETSGVLQQRILENLSFARYGLRMKLNTGNSQFIFLLCNVFILHIFLTHLL